MDGQPKTTGEGTWRHVSGSDGYAGMSGTYAGIMEAGTHSWTMTSPTTLDGAWIETAESASR